VEYLVALNNARTETVGATLSTCQPAGASFQCLFDSRYPDLNGGPSLVAGEKGLVAVSLGPLQCVVWKADAALPANVPAPAIAFTAPAGGSTFTFADRSRDGHVIAVRQELRADVTGGDGFAEVTFAMRRSSRPGQYDLLGTSDSPPYRIFWRPPADLAPGDELAFIATVNDLRGHRASAEIDHLRVAPTPIAFGIKGAVVPQVTREPDPTVTARAGTDLTLSITATGTGPIETRWLHDGREIAGAARPDLTLRNVTPVAAGHYMALLRNREGTTLSRDILVVVESPSSPKP
jgi:hypothetical protein